MSRVQEELQVARNHKTCESMQVSKNMVQEEQNQIRTIITHLLGFNSEIMMTII